MFAKFTDDKIMVFESYKFKESIKEVNGSMWDGFSNAWIIPCIMDNIILLQVLGCRFGDTLSKIIQSIIIAKDKDIKEIEPMPIKEKPYNHQIEAYNMACRKMKIFNGGGDVYT